MIVSRTTLNPHVVGDSPEHHLERGRAYAAARGWVVKEVYNLAGVSGKSVVANAETKRITGLIFSKLARL
jgi:site-specific DNA recombinase